MGFLRSQSKGYWAFLVLHLCQLIMALVVVGIYGDDLHTARRAHSYSDGKWVFAVVVGSFSAFTALAWSIPFVLRFAILFVWDFVLFVLWVAVFGLFGNMYIKENPEGDSGIQRMKNAVWIDLVNALLWLISTLAMAGYWWKHRTTASRFTGRARDAHLTVK